MTFKPGPIGVVLLATTYSVMALIGKGGVDAWLTIACAVLLAVAMVLVAQQLHISARAQFVVWFSLLFLNFASVAIEGTLFAPAAAPPSELAMNLLRLASGSAVMAALMAALFGIAGAYPARRAAPRSFLGWLWRIVAAAVIYVVLYLVLGGLNYTFVTHPYYEAHAGSLTVPSAATILAYEPIRGVLIALSVLPLSLAFRGRTRVSALIVGLLLFVVGGVVPLLPQASLPLFVRVSSLWEILGQNFLTGVACAYLFHDRPALKDYRAGFGHLRGTVR